MNLGHRSSRFIEVVERVESRGSAEAFARKRQRRRVAQHSAAGPLTELKSRPVDADAGNSEIIRQRARPAADVQHRADSITVEPLADYRMDVAVATAVGREHVYRRPAPTGVVMVARIDRPALLSHLRWP